MSLGGGRAALLGAFVAGLALGAAAGWLAARATVPPPPPPPLYRNPLADARKDEVLVYATPEGDTQAYRVDEADRDTVLLSVQNFPKAGPGGTRHFRAARTFFGTLVILEGDIDPGQAEAALQDFVIESAVFEDLRVESLDRTFHCWKVTGRYRSLEARTYWITDELPVHGVARIDGPRGKRYEVKSFSFGKGK